MPHGLVHNEALANELAGRFYLARGLETAGYAYLRNARNCYDRWERSGKVKQLDERYPRLRERSLNVSRCSRHHWPASRAVGRRDCRESVAGDFRVRWSFPG